MLAYIAPIFVFGLVVFVHELGHFLAAKAPAFTLRGSPSALERRCGIGRRR